MNHFLNFNLSDIFFSRQHIFSFQTDKETSFARSLIVFFLLSLLALSSRAQSYPEAQEAFAAGEFQRAVNIVEEALDRSGDDPRILLLAGNIHSALGVRDSFRNEHTRNAARHYQDALLRSQENSGLYTEAKISQEKLWQKIVIMAAEFEQDSQYEKALKLLEQAKTVLPKKEKTYLLAGKLAFGMKNYEVAEQNFNFLIDSLNYDGKQVQEVLNSLLTFSLVEDSLMEAGRVLKSAQEAEGDSLRTQMMKVKLLISKGKMDYAELYMDSIALSAAEEADFYLQMGKRYQSDQYKEKAIKYYEKALSADPSLADARYLLAVSYQQMARDIMTTADTDELEDQQKEQARMHLDHAKEQLETLRQQKPDYPLLNYTLKDVKKSLEKLS